MESGREDYAWWIVRQPGARLARWIADNHTGKEYVLDLTSGELVEVE
jgi:predicted nicotinamide N-methyase